MNDSFENKLNNVSIRSPKLVMLFSLPIDKIKDHCERFQLENKYISDYSKSDISDVSNSNVLYYIVVGMIGVITKTIDFTDEEIISFDRFIRNAKYVIIGNSTVLKTFVEGNYRVMYNQPTKEEIDVIKTKIIS